MAAKGTLVCTYATLLDTTVRQIRELTSAIERAAMAHSDATVFTSFPRIGKVNAAQILAELGVRDRFLTEEQLAGEAGVAPVTRMSGLPLRQTARLRPSACHLGPPDVPT